VGIGVWSMCARSAEVRARGEGLGVALNLACQPAPRRSTFSLTYPSLVISAAAGHGVRLAHRLRRDTEPAACPLSPPGSADLSHKDAARPMLCRRCRDADAAPPTPPTRAAASCRVLVSKVLSSLLGKKEYRVLILGLDNAGAHHRPAPAPPPRRSANCRQPPADCARLPFLLQARRPSCTSCRWARW
jgi:hypothetical protein